MKTLKHLMIAFFGLLLSASLFAQQGERREIIEERLEAQHVAFITQKLQLTPEESAKFWPIYNEFREKEKALRKEARPEGPLADMTDAEANALIEGHFEAEQKVLDLKRQYTEKMRSAIPPRKIVRLKPAEEAFKMQILQRLRERRVDGPMRRN